MLGTLASPLAGEMSRKPTAGGDETEGWQMGSAVDEGLPAGAGPPVPDPEIPTQKYPLYFHWLERAAS